VLSEREVYGVLGETKMCFHLFDLALAEHAARKRGPVPGPQAHAPRVCGEHGEALRARARHRAPARIIYARAHYIRARALYTRRAARANSSDAAARY